MHSHHREFGFHQLIRAMIALGFATFIAYLVKGDYISLYIAPRMVIYVKLSSIALYFIGMFQLSVAYRYFFSKAPSCDCTHAPSRSLPKHVMIYGLFLLPLLLGFALPNTTLGTALAAKKGMNLSASTSGRVSASRNIDPSFIEKSATSTTRGSQKPTLSVEELNRLFPADDYNENFARLAKKLYEQDIIRVEEKLYMEILTALDLFMDQFQGRIVEIGGFVYRDKEMSDHQFVLGRFSMDCCSADALPYGVLVEFDKANLYPNDAWITITAQIGKTTYHDLEILSLEPIKIRTMEKPNKPYVYPNYEF